MRALVRLALLLLVACAAAPADAPKKPILVIDLTSSLEPECIKDSEFAFGGVGIGASEQEVLDALGAPETREISPNLLDNYISERWSYPGLDVDLFQDSVVGFAALDARWTTPSGLRIGMTQAELFEIFGARPRPSRSTSEETIYDIYFCNGGEVFDLGTSFQVYVDPDDTVNKLFIGTDTP